jgi:hypothetical protein
LSSTAAVSLVVTVSLMTVSASAAGRPPLPKPGPGASPPLSSAAELQSPGNYVRKPNARDFIAKTKGTKYCKPGPYNFYYGLGLGGRSYSGTLNLTRFCHQGARVSEISVSTDHRLYGVYNFYMKFDHQSVQRGYYNWRGRGNYSGYFVRVKYYFLYCYEPTRSVCTASYIMHLRSYVHEDGTSSTFRRTEGV